MFLATTLVYPLVLALLCIGAGLLVDRCSGSCVPWPLIPVVGAAASIALTQLSTYIPPLAPATPYLLAAFGAGGFVLGAGKLRAARQIWATSRLWVAVPVLAYLIALAPVLLSGRATFSSYLALADSAVHLMGADFLIRHGQDYSHLDLRNSYGRYMNAYYNTSYPSGSDTLFGASGFLLHLPLIWAFQPFNAFMLAIATGPAWVLARRLGLEGRWAALAALSATLPALVYGYELIGSVKEISALPMLLTLGALLVGHQRWLRGPPRGVIPFALVVGAGVSALGVAFGVWVLAAAAVLIVVAFFDGQAARAQRPERMLLAGVGVLVLLVCAWPTWIDLSGSLRVAQRIASTSNPGNLYTPLELRQVFGVWMSPSYTQVPSGADLTLTNLLIVLTLLGVLLGVVHMIRVRAYALAAWVGLIVAVWLGVSVYATTWADAKTLMLTSPVVVLMAWGESLRCANRASSSWHPYSLRCSYWAPWSLTPCSTTTPIWRRRRAMKSSRP